MRVNNPFRLSLLSPPLLSLSSQSSLFSAFSFSPLRPLSSWPFLFSLSSLSLLSVLSLSLSPLFFCSLSLCGIDIMSMIRLYFHVACHRLRQLNCQLCNTQRRCRTHDQVELQLISLLIKLSTNKDSFVKIKYVYCEVNHNKYRYPYVRLDIKYKEMRDAIVLRIKHNIPNLETKSNYVWQHLCGSQ